REDIGALRHEMDAAKDDEVRLAAHRALARELPRVAGVVSELDHFVALIVMTENQQTRSERRLCLGDAPIHFLRRQAQIPLGQRLPLADLLVFVPRETRDVHGALPHPQTCRSPCPTRICCASSRDCPAMAVAPSRLCAGPPLVKSWSRRL